MTGYPVDWFQKQVWQCYHRIIKSSHHTNTCTHTCRCSLSVSFAQWRMWKSEQPSDAGRPLSHLVTDRCLQLFNHTAYSSPQEDHHHAVIAALIWKLPPNWKRPSGRPSHTWLHEVETDLCLLNTGLVLRLLFMKTPSSCPTNSVKALKGKHGVYYSCFSIRSSPQTAWIGSREPMGKSFFGIQLEY